jgi:hypothetical protein
MSRGGELVNVPQSSPRMEPIRIEIGRGLIGFWHHILTEFGR